MQKSIIRVAAATGLLLLIPLGLQSIIGTGVDGQGFNWQPEDFIAMGVLVFVTGLVFEFAMQKFPKQRVAAGAVITLGFLYVWTELAVGIFTNLGS